MRGLSERKKSRKIFENKSEIWKGCGRSWPRENPAYEASGAAIADSAVVAGSSTSAGIKGAGLGASGGVEVAA